MKNVVTFETAQRLLAAGFHRPHPQAGQYWYSPHFGGEMLVILDANSGIETSGGLCDYVFFGTSVVFVDRKLDNDFVFAPTAADILFILPGYSLARLENGNGEGWVTLDTEGTYFKFSEYSPAESAALAYLEINETK